MRKYCLEGKSSYNSGCAHLVLAFTVAPTGLAYTLQCFYYLNADYLLQDHFYITWTLLSREQLLVSSLNRWNSSVRSRQLFRWPPTVCCLPCRHLSQRLYGVFANRDPPFLFTSRSCEPLAGLYDVTRLICGCRASLSDPTSQFHVKYREGGG